MPSSQALLTQGSIAKHLTNMTTPVLFGIFMMMLQNFIDMWFIGQVGDGALAALSFTIPIVMVVISVAIGLGAGTSSVVARAFGAGKPDLARRLSTDSLLLCFVITGAICVLGLFTIDPLFRLLGAPEDLLPLITGYMQLIYVGVPFLVVGMVGMSSMRATGDTRLPSLLMVYMAIANIILDPILIFGLGPIPAMGLNGAAMAGLLSRAIIFFGTLYLMTYKQDLLTFKRPGRAEVVSSWKSILHVGIPAAGTNAIIPVATGVITAMLARFGPETVAGFGVASRVESLMLVIYYAISAIIGPFVGQNSSANQTARIYEALRLCTWFCLASGLLIALVLGLSGDFIPSLFSDNAEVIRVATLFLLIVPLSYGTYGMVMVMNASFNGIGKPMPAVIISVGRMVALYIPIAFVAGHYYGVAGIFAAYAIANVVTGVVSYAWAKAAVKKECQSHTESV